MKPDAVIFNLPNARIIVQDGVVTHESTNFYTNLPWVEDITDSVIAQMILLYIRPQRDFTVETTEPETTVDPRVRNLP